MRGLLFAVAVLVILLPHLRLSAVHVGLMGWIIYEEKQQRTTETRRPTEIFTEKNNK